METHRILVHHADVDGIPVEVDYADIFVVVRDGSGVPAPTDWEVQLRTSQFQPMTSARHDLALTAPDGTCVRGAAITRFSDGHRHLFRGDSALDGFSGHVPPAR